MDKKEQNTAQVQIRIQPSLYERFKKMCEKKYGTISGVIKDLMVKAVEESEGIKRLNIRYYDENGKYLDHGRLIGSIANIGDTIHPFMTVNGECNWKVVDVKIPSNDSCFEICVKDLGIKSNEDK